MPQTTKFNVWCGDRHEREKLLMTITTTPPSAHVPMTGTVAPTTAGAAVPATFDGPRREVSDLFRQHDIFSTRILVCLLWSLVAAFPSEGSHDSEDSVGFESARTSGATLELVFT